MTSPPRLVALCGWPKSGKTTLADHLVERYGATLVDDGAGLRQAAMAFYGLSWEDVHTQEGKARTRVVCGKTFTHRQLLGDLGNLLEGFYGQQIVPETAIAALDASPNDGAPFYCFPSVRKTQGLTYRAKGGMVIEVLRPGTTCENDFDRYDDTFCNGALVNNGTQAEFLDQADQLFDKLGFKPAGVTRS